MTILTAAVLSMVIPHHAVSCSMIYVLTAFPARIQPELLSEMGILD
jgi:hypothetical protein